MYNRKTKLQVDKEEEKGKKDTASRYRCSTLVSIVYLSVVNSLILSFRMNRQFVSSLRSLVVCTSICGVCARACARVCVHVDNASGCLYHLFRHRRNQSKCVQQHHVLCATSDWVPLYICMYACGTAFQAKIMKVGMWLQRQHSPGELYTLKALGHDIRPDCY